MATYYNPFESEILAAYKKKAEEFDKEFDRRMSILEGKLPGLQTAKSHPVKEAINSLTTSSKFPQVQSSVVGPESEPSQVHELGSVTNNTTSFVEDCTNDAGEKSSPEHHRLVTVVSVSTESDLSFEKKMKSVPTADVDSDLDTCSDLVMAKLTDAVEEEVIFNNFSSELVLTETEVAEGKETHGFANQIYVPNGSISICSQGVCQNASMDCSLYFIMCARTDSYILVPAVKVDDMSVLLRDMNDFYKVESSLLCRLPPWRGIKGVRRCRYVKIIDGNYVYDKGKSDMYDIEWYGAVVEENTKVKRDDDVAELENGVGSLFESVARFHSHMLSVGHTAGLEVIRSIDEHTVISMEHEFEKKNSGAILVFDPGGGTLNVSVHEEFVRKLNGRDSNTNVDVGAIAQNFCGLSELGCYALIEDMFDMFFSTAKDDRKWILRGHIQHGSENLEDFTGRVMVDVGAGSGILSLFAAPAGAKHVYVVEASEMAEYARKLIAGNPSLSQRVTAVKGKVEEVELPEKADILISEPMGTLLVNERMLESYVIARDRFLVPNGKMFPTLGRIHMAPFSDEFLFIEIANKARFWQQQNYYGVDLTPLHGTTFQGYFSQPVVDAFDPRLLVASPICHVIDFTKSKEEDLYEIDIPLKYTPTVGTRVHGLACWFDVLFDGSTVKRWLTTAPGAPATHWYQIRCVLSQPLYVMAGQEITGNLHMVAQQFEYNWLGMLDAHIYAYGWTANREKFQEQFIMFSSPRPPEVADLEDKVNFMGRGMLRIK